MAWHISILFIEVWKMLLHSLVFLQLKTRIAPHRSRHSQIPCYSNATSPDLVESDGFEIACPASN
jgi:hypothetical protein